MESRPPGVQPSSGSHWAVYVVLAVLTAAMVAVSGMDLGLGPNGGVWAIGGLALLQAAVLLVFGMHLKSETGLVIAVALLPLFLVVVIILLNLQDAVALAGR